MPEICCFLQLAKKHSPLGSIQKKCGILTCSSPAKHKQAIHIQKHAIKLRGSGDPFVAGDPNAQRPTQLNQKETYLLIGVGPNTPKQTLWAKSKVPMISSRPRHIFRTQTAQSLKDPQKGVRRPCRPSLRPNPQHQTPLCTRQASCFAAQIAQTRMFGLGLGHRRHGNEFWG